MSCPAKARRAARIAVWAGAAALGVALVALGAIGVRRAELIAPRPSLLITDRNGVFLTQVSFHPTRADYGYWPLAHPPDRVARATLALEDKRFRTHPGVDLRALARAAWRNLRGQTRRSGASTLAMQIARMQQPAPRTLWAKMQEAATALALTARFDRDALLAHYLRLSPYGAGSHGVAHAARFFFDKPVDDLSWAEIALLSAAPQSPTRMNLFKPDGMARAKARGRRALDELARQKVIDPIEHAAALRQLSAMPRPLAPRRPDALHAVLHLEKQARAGALAPVSADDPRVRATLDLALQRRVTLWARRYVDQWREAGAQQAAVLLVARENRAVLARVGSLGFATGPAGAFDFVAARRSPGSTLKPFLYALAFDKGLLKTTDILADQPEGASGVGNADGLFLGPMLPRQALANSRNVPATNLIKRVGLEATDRFLRDLKLHEGAAPAETYGLSMAIGALPTQLGDLVRAYAALADDGVMSDLTDAHGQIQRPPRRVMSVDAARLIMSMLSDPMARLPAFPRYGPTEYPFAVALKTGTSQGWRDAWTIAASKKFIVGVWVGRGDAGTMRAVSGASAPARLAHALMTMAHGARVGEIAEAPFPAPEGRVAMALCATSGKRDAGGCGQTLTEWVRPDEAPPFDTPPLFGAAQPPNAAVRVATVDAPPALSDAPVRIDIATPENDTRLWRNPEQPVARNVVALKARVGPGVEQIVWVVDGRPFATTEPDKTVYWPMQPGVHRIQARLPLAPAASRAVRIVVE